MSPKPGRRDARDRKWRGGSFSIWKVKDGHEGYRPIVEVKAPRGFDWVGTEHQVDIDVQGDEYRVSMDGEVRGCGIPHP